jgi:hypothetical protein
MDGGIRQQEMAERLKREVKKQANYRRGELAVHMSNNEASSIDTSLTEMTRLHQEAHGDLDDPMSFLLKAATSTHQETMEVSFETSAPRLQPEVEIMDNNPDAGDNLAFGQSDFALLGFYMENLLPFLFPFYHPSFLQGGRAWMLEMMNRPILRQAILCQSHYFLSLVAGMANCDIVSRKVLAQTRDAFGALRQSLKVFDDSGITEHLPCAVRVMTSIIQVHHLEVATSSFDNWQAHLNAALAIFEQLLHTSDVAELAKPGSSFGIIMSRLGPSPRFWPSQGLQLPSAEQAAFRFSTSILILDDLIASTILQTQPRLYEYHRSLLGDSEGNVPFVDLEDVVGLQNWVVLQISEISALDAWKQRCCAIGNLDVLELVRRATDIKAVLVARLIRLEADPIVAPEDNSSPLDAFIPYSFPSPKGLNNQRSLVTRVWAHAALIYLFIVVSGWQPASADVRCHTNRIIELTKLLSLQPMLMRTVVWPFCVAGCVAEPAQESYFRGAIITLQPPGAFSTVYKALEIMEHVWSNRGVGDPAARDLATCFRSLGSIVLLV